MGSCPALAAYRGISSGSTVWWNAPDDLIESAQDLFLPTTMAQVLQVLSVRVMAIAQPSHPQPHNHGHPGRRLDDGVALGCQLKVTHPCNGIPTFITW